MKTKSKIYMYVIFGLVLISTGIAQAVEYNFMALFPLFAGGVMLITAYRLKREKNN